MTIRPLNDSILIFPQNARRMSDFLHIPETVASELPPVWGTVVALGPNATKELKVGQVVLFEMHAGTEKRLFIDGDHEAQHEVRIIYEKDVLGFLE